ncbi:hypothetical protein C5746_29090 [Streptomyces atratus]|uniref:Acyl-CoA thioesterase-like C-terminal domain-containing protein n=1 Tax=Streptomyces atratus TaxID=1893 RepID=A0A2Z5JJ15_STRAR|nr:hypothetical protein C5746_29090 [Streptomyces atratus]
MNAVAGRLAADGREEFAHEIGGLRDDLVAAVPAAVAAPAPGPLRVSITTRNLAGGFLEEDADVWGSADRLVAQSRQLARAPRA